MHYVDSTMVCRSGKGYSRVLLEFQKKKGGKTISEFSDFNQYIYYWWSKEPSPRNSFFGHM